MSNNATAFLTGKQDQMKVIQAVTKAINKMVVKKLNKHLENIGTNRIAFRGKKYDSSKWTSSANVNSYDFETFQIIFGIGDGDKKSADRRILWVNTTCSCDYSDVYEGDKIIFSTGSWGSHIDIMEVVLKVLVKFGNVYYRKNCHDDFMHIK